MADIELVIKIPEEVYKSIINRKNYISYQEYVEEAIKNGTPLPKGHGRLIDADALDKDFSKCTCKCDCNFLTCPVYSQKVIIEADKESKNADSN